MPPAAPRIDPRLVAALARLDGRGRSIAEMHRDRGRVAEHLGLCRPSYEQTRVVVHALRAGRRSSGIGEALLDVAFRVRPPDAVLDVLAGTR